MKFRIDIGPERLKKHFSERQSMKNRAKSTTSTPGARHPPATYYGSSHWIFLEIFEKKIAPKNIFFEHETKTQKFDRSIFSIRSSRYVAQFLARLEHSGYAKLRGNFFFHENVTKIPENASLQWDPHSKVTSPGGEHEGNKKISCDFFSNMKQKLENLTDTFYI